MIKTPQERAVEMILTAIAEHPHLSGDFLLKGGRLMHQKYKSPRTTTDIDFSSSRKSLNKAVENEIKADLNEALQDETIKPESFFSKAEVSSIKIKPSKKFHADGTPKKRTFPALYIKIKSIPKGKRTEIITDLDCSFNEFTGERDKILLNQQTGCEIACYSLEMLVAEKFRALLQQEKRNLARYQDIFDLHFLISNYRESLAKQRALILDYLQHSLRNKEIDALFCATALDSKALKSRAKTGYETLKTDLSEEELPDFELAYEAVNRYFKSLPWLEENWSNPL
ncbi:nucleotidyl transferase AbiEii/AbiGii toxin family protein [Acetobacteraceae bacterium]|nr:nucleotidyl transferase AbiEii/AbiGii toxin family protein [Acetobacteraceae bacterium]